MPPTIKHNPAASGVADPAARADQAALLAWLAQQVEQDSNAPPQVQAAAGRILARHGEGPGQPSPPGR